MEAMTTLEALGDPSPLASARLRRKLARPDAAARAGLTEDEVAWLEERRVYRFATPDDALLALLLYATALGIDHAEARELAGLPSGETRGVESPRGRLAVLAAVTAAVAALVAAFVVPARGEREQRVPTGPALPAPWQITVDVLNGSGDINHTRRVATRIGALSYTIRRVRRAGRFDYPRTVVYYERGGRDNAIRLARKLGVVTAPLPGGANPRRLVVIVGPPKGP